MTSRRPLLPLAAVVTTVVLWASAFVAIRHVGRQLSPGALTLGRLLVGSVVLGAFVVARPCAWPARRHWPRLLVCGLVWFGVYNLALNAAERRVDAGTAAMLVNVGPLLIAVLAGVFLKEGFPRRFVSGGVLAFAGVVLIGVATSTHASADGVGVLLCVVAAAGYAVGVVTQKPLLAELSALQVTWLACSIGAVACLPFGPALVRELAAAGPSSWAWVAYLGAFPTSLAFTTWAYALARTSAGRLGATTYLVPPVAIALSWLFLGETPAALAVVGGAICVAGVALSRRAPVQRRTPAAGLAETSTPEG